MKKILFLFLFATALNSATAQDAKPTKEETQKFINNVFSQVIGKPMYGQGPNLLGLQTFSENFKTFKITENAGGVAFFLEKYSDIGNHLIISTNTHLMN